MRFSTHYCLRQNRNSWPGWTHQRLSKRRLLQRDDKRICKEMIKESHFTIFVHSSLENFEEKENKFGKE